MRKWLKAPLKGEPRYRRSDRPGKLSAFHEALKLALKADAHRPRHERRTARALHTEIYTTRDTLSLHDALPICKWLKAPLEGEPRYRRSDRPGKLSVFHEALKLALKADGHRPKHERRTARALHSQIRGEGYDGSYSRVTDFVRAWRQGEGQSVSANAFVPLLFELGEAYQFDWSEEGLVVGGIYYRMQVSQLKLCASRAFWLVAYPSQGHEMLFDAHTRSFAAMGGDGLAIAQRGIYDNRTTAVDKVKKGKSRTVNKRFAAMCTRYLVDADRGRRASSWPRQRRLGLKERRHRDECAGQPPAQGPRRGPFEAQGSTRPSCASAASSNSTPGWATAAAPCGTRFDIPNTSRLLRLIRPQAA